MNSIIEDSNKNQVESAVKCEDVESGGKAAEVPSDEVQLSKITARRGRQLRKFLGKVAIMTVLLAVLVAISAVIYYYLGWTSLVQLVLVALVAYIVTWKKYRWFYVALKTAPRDLKALTRYARLLIQVRNFQKKDVNLADVFRQHVSKHPNKVCVIYEDTEWTFAQVEEYSNKIANIFKSHGYRKGDLVSLFMENRVEFICTWLGLSKLGVIVPLINTNLRLHSLVHSITIVKSQAVIFTSELSEAIREISDKIDTSCALYQLNTMSNNQMSSDDTKIKNLNTLLDEASSSAPNVPDKISHNDHLLYIYTSGTTGLPKAAVITHARFIFIAAAIHCLANFKPVDKFYTPLPLYHTAGGCMTIGQMLLYGSTVVIRKKFSASQYFPDCRKYGCTAAQYIGEMCRYIMAVPPKPEDKQHQVKIIYGNGLRPQIWAEYKERFNISYIAEFYGATEGNANITNVDETVGAVGFLSRIIPSVYPISIIKVDPVSGEPVRNAKGLCMECEPGEPGVFIGKIIPNNPTRQFLGYVDKSASQKKVVHDVFKKGDSAFISGDILVADELGYLYFKDRTGDTFRWKGENVSTSEVEAIMSNIVEYKDVVVYGVEIHGLEGRAGMAAILDPGNTLDLDKMSEGMKKALPAYARPQFVRILQKLEMTGTYKLKKSELQKDGFDPSNITDKIYYFSSTGTYAPLTTEIYKQINTGKIRL